MLQIFGNGLGKSEDVVSTLLRWLPWAAVTLLIDKAALVGNRFQHTVLWAGLNAK
jgi:hypothetical protein